MDPVAYEKGEQIFLSQCIADAVPEIPQRRCRNETQGGTDLRVTIVTYGQLADRSVYRVRKSVTVNFTVAGIHTVAGSAVQSLAKFAQRVKAVAPANSALP